MLAKRLVVKHDLAAFNLFYLVSEEFGKTEALVRLRLEVAHSLQAAQLRQVRIVINCHKESPQP
jgi:hypothetical protein